MLLSVVWRPRRIWPRPPGPARPGRRTATPGCLPPSSGCLPGPPHLRSRTLAEAALSHDLPAEAEATIRLAVRSAWTLLVRPCRASGGYTRPRSAGPARQAAGRPDGGRGGGARLAARPAGSRTVCVRIAPARTLRERRAADGIGNDGDLADRLPPRTRGQCARGRASRGTTRCARPARRTWPDLSVPGCTVGM
jgi:hypothetical protein